MQPREHQVLPVCVDRYPGKKSADDHKYNSGDADDGGPGHFFELKGQSKRKMRRCQKQFPSRFGLTRNFH